MVGCLLIMQIPTPHSSLTGFESEGENLAFAAFARFPDVSLSFTTVSPQLVNIDRQQFILGVTGTTGGWACFFSLFPEFLELDFFFPSDANLIAQLYMTFWTPNTIAKHFFFEVCFENHFKVTVQKFTGLFDEDSKLFWLYHTCALLWASSIQFTTGHRPMGLNLINYNNRVSEHIHLCHYVINIRKWTSIIFCRGKLYEVQLEIN